MSELYLKDLVPIVELQAMELKRLLRDKEQLSRRIDSLIEEIGWLRESQQQDLVLREKETALRLQMQDTVNDLLRERGPATPPDSSPPARQDQPAPAARKTTLVRAGGAVSEELFPAREADGIPSFLTAHEVHGGSEADPPIRKLLTRIRARSAAG